MVLLKSWFETSSKIPDEDEEDEENISPFDEDETDEFQEIEDAIFRFPLTEDQVRFIFSFDLQP